MVDQGELARRKEQWKPPAQDAPRGYTRLHLEQVQQANLGCDLAFLRPPMRHTLA